MVYAIQVRFDNDWVYVVNIDSNPTSVRTFKTLEEAEAYAESWRLPEHPEFVKVVEYK